MIDYETVQRNRNIRVGFFVLIGLCALVWLIYKFGDLPIKASEYRSFEVFVQFPTAQGVQKNTSVQFCGYPVGRVTGIMAPELLEDKDTSLVYYQTKVVLSIDKKYKTIPSNIDIKVMTRGLGSSYIEMKVDPCLPLVAKDPNRPETKYLVNKMLVQGSAGQTSEFFPAESQEKLDSLANRLLDLIDNSNAILGDMENRENIKKSLANMREVTFKMAQMLEEFQKFVASGTDVSEELSKTTKELRMILQKVGSGEGSAAKLINDGRLYENLLENTEQLQLLLEEAKRFVSEYREKGFKIKL